MNKILVGAITVGIVAGIAYSLHYLRNNSKVVKKNKERKKIVISDGHNSETIDSPLKLNDILYFFRAQPNIQEDIHVPFIALPRGNSQIEKIIEAENKIGYKLLIAGIYNQKTEKFVLIKGFYTPNFDSEISDILGSETLVTLK